MEKRTDASRSQPGARRVALGRALRDARGEMTQTQLAAAVGVPQSCISSWEAGKVELSLDRVAHIEAALGLPSGWLAVAAGYCSAAAFTPMSTKPMAPDQPAADFPERVADWLDRHRVLIEAGAHLRGPRGCASLAESLAASGPLAQLRAAWEFWEHVVACRGEVPVLVITRAVALSDLALIERALWGDRDAA